MGRSHPIECPRAPPVADQTLLSLKPCERRLIEMARKVGYGWLTNIPVHKGELCPPPRLTARRNIRLGKLDTGRSVRPVCNDFRLKDQHRDFIQKLRGIENGLIVSVEVQDGLPVQMLVQEELPLETRSI